MTSRNTIDLDKYLRSKVKVLNDSGGRGFDTGVRTFSCPLCRDSKGRGWLNVAFWTAGCFNVGCVAHERLDGGAVAWAQRVGNIRSRAETMGMLRREFDTEKEIVYKPIPRKGDDFVRWPETMRRFVKGPSAHPIQRTYEIFVEKQWNIGLDDMLAWGLGYCTGGFYAQRVIIPIIMGGEPVAFQARTILPKSEKPKYITSRHGAQDDPKAECFRTASAILYNYDRIKTGRDVVLVEGVGDVMGWHKGNLDREPIANAMLGVSLTPEKLGLLIEAAPSKVILAVDAEPRAQKDAAELLSTLRDNDLVAELGSWAGGKDAGSGARLVSAPSTLLDADLMRLR